MKGVGMNDRIERLEALVHILTNRVNDLTKRLETIEASDVIREAELREELGYLSIDFRKRGKNYNCDD
jgi:hypothetical protein